jgi:hypothetical protein
MRWLVEGSSRERELWQPHFAALLAWALTVRSRQWRRGSGGRGRRQDGSSGGPWLTSIVLAASYKKGKALVTGWLRRHRPKRVLTENGAVAAQGTDGGENFECGRLCLTRWMQRLRGVWWSEHAPAQQFGGGQEEAEWAVAGNPFGRLQWLRPSLRVGTE